jgi:PAS domain-containing protein
VQISERQIQDRLGAALQRLATLERRASAAKESRATQSLLTDFRRLARDLERAFESLQEAAARHAALQRDVEIAARRANLLLDLTPLPYVLVHTSGIIIEGNAAAAKALNLSQRHLKGKPFDLFLQGNREAFLSKLSSLREGADPERWVAVVRPRERYPRPFAIVASTEGPGQIALVLSTPDRALEPDAGSDGGHDGEPSSDPTMD